jgi:hypothetical protein
MLKIEIVLSESEPLATPSVPAELPVNEKALEKAFCGGIREGKSQFAAELTEYIYRHYGGETKTAVGAAASHIIDMICEMSHG